MSGLLDSDGAANLWTFFKRVCCALRDSRNSNPQVEVDGWASRTVLVDYRTIADVRVPIEQVFGLTLKLRLRVDSEDGPCYKGRPGLDRTGVRSGVRRECTGFGPRCQVAGRTFSLDVRDETSVKADSVHVRVANLPGVEGHAVSLDETPSVAEVLNLHGLD